MTGGIAQKELRTWKRFVNRLDFLTNQGCAFGWDAEDKGSRSRAGARSMAERKDRSARRVRNRERVQKESLAVVERVERQVVQLAVRHDHQVPGAEQGANRCN